MTIDRLFFLFHAPNRWFDSIPEPARFTGFFITVGLLLVAGMVSAEVDVAVMILLGMVALYRWHYLYISQSP